MTVAGSSDKQCQCDAMLGNGQHDVACPLYEPLTSKTMTHIEELRHVAAMESCSWDYAQKLMRSSAAEIERLRGALESLWPGLVLDLRYAEPDDDKDAMQSRIDTVRDALNGERRASDETRASPFDRAAILADPRERRISMSFETQEQYEAALVFLDMADTALKANEDPNERCASCGVKRSLHKAGGVGSCQNWRSSNGL